MKDFYDVIIIGSGAAGLNTALNLAPNLRILILSKRRLTLSNSALAQGGIASVFDPDNDSFELHFEDSLIAGGYQNNRESLAVLVQNGPDCVKDLIDNGVDFDKDAQGNYHLTLEGGHSRHRILHHKDATGREIVHKLLYRVQRRSNIDIMEDAMVCDLQQTAGGFALDILSEQEHVYHTCRFCVLATGGIGRVYEFTTNSAIATGDGICMAHRLGAKIKNISLIQFHPTAFANNRTRESFLISEAVRGAGAYLLNCDGTRFMQRYDERLELAPRDVVSRSILAEQKRTGSNKFYLDISRKDSAFIKNRFPMIYENLLHQGFDLTTDQIPIYPCQHYLMGGIDVNLSGMSSIENLYAVGECSHTGVHGNNRLASNSLLEAVVFAKRAALEINQKAAALASAPPPAAYPFSADVGTKTVPRGTRTQTRHIMQQSYFVAPDAAEIKKGIVEITRLKKMLEEDGYQITPDFVEARSLVTIAYLILTEVLQKQETAAQTGKQSCSRAK